MSRGHGRRDPAARLTSPGANSRAGLPWCSAGAGGGGSAWSRWRTAASTGSRHRRLSAAIFAPSRGAALLLPRAVPDRDRYYRGDEVAGCFHEDGRQVTFTGVAGSCLVAAKVVAQGPSFVVHVVGDA